MCALANGCNGDLPLLHFFLQINNPPHRLERERLLDKVRGKQPFLNITIQNKQQTTLDETNTVFQMGLIGLRYMEDKVLYIECYCKRETHTE